MSRRSERIGGVKAPYSAASRQVLALAGEEAQRYSHNYIGQEHILLGLLRVQDGVAARALSTFGVNLDRARHIIETWLGRGDRPLAAGAPRFTVRAKRALELAAQEAKQRGAEDVGTEHLLLGMLREGDGVGFRILQSLDVNLEDVYAVLDRAAGEESTTSEVPRNTVITVRLSDRDIDAIDALVEAGIRSTRSDAAAWLISTAIDGNPSLFKRVYSTVTDIRRLRGAAQRLVGQGSSAPSDEHLLSEPK